MTVLETLEAEIATAKADVAAKEAALEMLKTEAGAWLGTEIIIVKSWFEAIKAHL